MKKQKQTNVINPTFIEMIDCPECGAKPGQVHEIGCDIETCSCCGGQRLSCFCPIRSHDRKFARWTGFMPGTLECIALNYFTDPKPILGIMPDYNRFYFEGLHKIFLVKPR